MISIRCGALPSLAVAEPVGHDGVAVGQALETRHELEADAGQVIGFDLPHGLALLIHLDDVPAARHVAAGDEGVAVRQADDAVRAARGGDFPHFPALRVIFADDLLAVVGDEVVAVGQLPGVAHVEVAAVFARGEQTDFLHDLAVRSQFEQAPGVALADEGVAVGEPLAGVDFAAGFVAEDDGLLACDFLHAVAGVEEQVAVGQRPQIVAVARGVFPLDFAIGVDDEDLAAGVVGANEVVAFAFLDWPWCGGGLLLGAGEPRRQNCQDGKASAGREEAAPLRLELKLQHGTC